MPNSVETGAITYAIVLAAGEGRRFGAIKQLAEVAGRPLISIALENCRQAQLARTFVVLGANAEQISPHLPTDVTALWAPDWSQGMGHSLAFAIGQLPADASHVLILLADQAALDGGDIRRLLRASQQAPQQIVAAYYGGRAGVPAIFSRAFFPQLCALQGDSGARALLRANRDSLVTVDIPRAAIDIDRPQDLQKIQ